MNQLFYLQDSRSYVGNDVLWWSKEGGYTTDLSKAATFVQEEAMRMHVFRGTDIPWPVPYILMKVRPAVDMQYINREEALAGTGITLIKEPKPSPEVHRCRGCMRFLSNAQFWSGCCPNCGTDNRP